MIRCLLNLFGRNVEAELADVCDRLVNAQRKIEALTYANDVLLRRNAELSDSLNRHLQAAVYGQ